jgi:hypothetical protein
MRLQLILTFVLALAFAFPMRAADAPQAGEAATRIYIAVFGITIGSDSELQNFHVIKVFEPLIGTNEPANLELPPAYIESAKKQVEAAHLMPTLKDGKPAESFTAFLYVPHTSGPAGASSPQMSLESLDGTMANVSSFELKGVGCQASNFGKPIGASALFFTYYAVPLPKDTAEDRENTINAEIERGMANFGGAQLISRKNLSLGDQSIVEVVVKSPKSKVLSLRCRMICTAKHMLALTATTPDDLDAATVQTLDKMFEEFRFR